MGRVYQTVASHCEERCLRARHPEERYLRARHPEERYLRRGISQIRPCPIEEVPRRK